MSGYIIEHNFSYGWDTFEHDENENPIVYDTIGEAQDEIADFLDTIKDSALFNDYSPDDFRITKLK